MSDALPRQAGTDIVQELMRDSDRNGYAITTLDDKLQNQQVQIAATIQRMSALEVRMSDGLTLMHSLVNEKEHVHQSAVQLGNDIEALQRTLRGYNGTTGALGRLEILEVSSEAMQRSVNSSASWWWAIAQKVVEWAILLALAFFLTGKLPVK